MRLVSDWKRAWRWFSVQAMIASAALLGAWSVLPADLKAVLPDVVVRLTAIFLLGLGVAGRLVQQSPGGKAEGEGGTE